MAEVLWSMFDLASGSLTLMLTLDDPMRLLYIPLGVPTEDPKILVDTST